MINVADISILKNAGILLANKPYRDMSNFTKTLLIGIFLIFVVYSTGLPTEGKINFNIIEQQSIFFSNDQMKQKAQDYLTAHFPQGYPVASAMAELSKAGAKCYYRLDPHDPKNYFCNYTRPGHGIYYFFETIDWGIAINFSSDKKTVKFITVSRYGISL